MKLPDRSMIAAWYRILVVLCLLPLPARCGYAQGFITPEQAIGAVRIFEGDNNLLITCDPLEETLEGAVWEHKWWYDLDDVDGASRNRSWRVDAVTGEITGSTYHDAFPSDQTDEPFGPLTQEQCLLIAEGHARSKYADFDAMGFQLAIQRWDDDGWMFSWRQKDAWGASTPNYVRVGVNPASGEIENYASRRVVMPVTQGPQITSQQAIDVAKAATGITTMDANPNPELEANPDGTFWSFRIRGVDAGGGYHNCWVVVNAITGEVVEVSLCDTESWGSSREAQSLLAAFAAIPIRDLAAAAPGTRVHWLGKEGARLFVGKDRYTLVPGRDSVEWTGGTIKLSKKIELVNGRLMVPQDLLGILKGASAPKKSPPAPAKSK